MPGPPQVDSAIPERIFESIQVGGDSTGGVGRFRVGAGEKQSVAGLTGVADKSDNPIRFACAPSLRCRNVARRFALGRPLVTNNLLIAGLIVLKDEIELLLEQGCPRIRSRTAQENKMIVDFKVRQFHASRGVDLHALRGWPR